MAGRTRFARTVERSVEAMIADGLLERVDADTVRLTTKGYARLAETEKKH